MRVVRNADLETEEESVFEELPAEEGVDYREAMVELLKRRKKLCAVRAELSRALDEEIVKKLCEYLDLADEQIFYIESPLDLSFVFQLQSYLSRYYFPRQSARAAPQEPQPPCRSPPP